MGVSDQIPSNLVLQVCKRARTKLISILELSGLHWLNLALTGTATEKANWQIHSLSRKMLKDRHFSSFLRFLGPHPRHMEVPRLAVTKWSYSCWPAPQPQQLGIWAASSTYTTAQGHARSLTHWARPGIELASSWILMNQSLTAEPWGELPEKHWEKTAPVQAYELIEIYCTP